MTAMTEVDFYILPHTEPEQRDLFACRLAEKAFRQGHRVYLHTADAESATQLDELLWNFRPQSFLPHALLDDSSDRVVIGWHDHPGDHSDVMINLALSVPAFIGRFARVAEVVVQSPHVRDPLRKSYAFYKDRGYPLRNNRL